MAAPDRTLPDGWHAPLGVLAPLETVDGYLTRRQALEGRCQRRDCRRSCEVALTLLATRGFGALTRRELLHLYRCNRLDGCGLDLAARPPTPALPLAVLARTPGIAVRIRCRGCGDDKRFTVEQLIGRLTKAGKGGEATDVMGVSRLLAAPCRVCQKSRWDLDVLWPSEDTIGWRAGQRP